MNNYDDQLYDFYFSEKQATHNDVYASDRFERSRTSVNRFKGERYTLCVHHGEKSAAVWDDLRLIGTGYFKDCTSEKNDGSTRNAKLVNLMNNIIKNTAQTHRPKKRKNIKRWMENRLRRIKFTKNPTLRQVARIAELESKV